MSAWSVRGLYAAPCTEQQSAQRTKQRVAVTGELLNYVGSVINFVDLLFASATIFLAYSVFGLTGFGSSITAIPFLIHVLPLQTAVSMMLLFDLVVCALLNFRERSHVDATELKRILPSLLVGTVVGIFLLLHAPKKPLFLLLGIFIILMFLWSNFFNKTAYKLSPRLAAPLGFIGGTFTTLFGTGGPLYTIYLAGRIDEKKILRSTLGRLIGITAIVRFSMFLVTGLLLDPTIYVIAAILFPCALAGFSLGSHLHEKFTSVAVKKIVWVILLAGGLSAVVKGI